MRCVFLQLPLLRIRRPSRWGAVWRWPVCWMLALTLLAAAAVQAQSVDLKSLKLERRDAELVLEFNARLTLGPAIEDALQRGVPMYFVASTVVFRNRWYWRDERVTRVTRSWRLAYQPLTGSWRVSLVGGLGQGYATLAEALAPLSRVSGWRLLEGERLEPGERYYVDFSFRLDNSQLPQPMQIDLGGDWNLSIERTLRIE